MVSAPEDDVAVNEGELQLRQLVGVGANVVFVGLQDVGGVKLVERQPQKHVVGGVAAANVAVVLCNVAMRRAADVGLVDFGADGNGLTDEPPKYP